MAPAAKAANKNAAVIAALKLSGSIAPDGQRRAVPESPFLRGQGIPALHQPESDYSKVKLL